MQNEHYPMSTSIIHCFPQLAVLKRYLLKLGFSCVNSESIPGSFCISDLEFNAKWFFLISRITPGGLHIGGTLCKYNPASNCPHFGMLKRSFSRVTVSCPRTGRQRQQGLSYHKFQEGFFFLSQNENSPSWCLLKGFALYLL